MNFVILLHKHDKQNIPFLGHRKMPVNMTRNILEEGHTGLCELCSLEIA